MERRYTRREFLGLFMLGAVAGLGLIYRQIVKPSKLETIPSPEVLKTVFDCFGLVDTPTLGGSIDFNLAVKDHTDLGSRFVLAYDPSDKLIEALKNAGIDITTRAYQKNNRFNQEELKRTISKLTIHKVPLVIQPFNEVNLRAENNNQEISPEDHIKEFLKAAELITNVDGRILLTPLAQNSRDPEAESIYFSRMIDALEESKTPKEWYGRHFGLGLHMYLFDPDEDPWERIKNLYGIFQQKIGVEVPIYITEAGLVVDEEHPHSQEQIAETTLKLMRSSLPTELSGLIKKICFWVSANLAQRPIEHWGDPNALRFEDAAWRGIKGVRLVFEAIRDFNDSRIQEKKEKKLAA